MVAPIRISDQGREFVNALNSELCKLTGVDHRISSAYHPQTNGQDERFNQTIQRSLRKMVNEDQDPVLGDGNHYIPNVNEGIQIHHVGNHWVTSSSIGGIVSVYDSKFYRNLSNSLQCQLATIYKLMITREEDGEVVDPHIAVCIPNIPQQQGVADCGVYAIAYAFHAARGENDI